ncbi:aspartate aminotransferase family protein [Cupriavidus sp. 2TAF22]|uniref:aspartate aminotransferase family protein n=1 Tax=unclassified Cupriavidus TaxID=2640874 RepID=UPI003F8E6B1C
MAESDTNQQNALNLESYFMGFTPNKQFKRRPRLIVKAEGSYIYGPQGERIFDGFSGLWCTGMGHCHPRIAEAVSQQMRQLDYVAAFNMSHPSAFRLADRIARLAPAGMNHVFFTTGGSDAVDTALKIAMGYHRINGDAARFRFIGRERGYHGVGMGGISVGGMVPNRKMFATMMMPGVDHLPHTHSLNDMAFSRGQPAWGAHLARELERLVALHDASTIAAVIVEPMAGSTGVLVPPVGYLEELRRICTRHGILLIFDEVICGFGRMGENFAAQRFNVKPDMITFAKTVTNGTQPLGGVIMTDEIFNTFMTTPEHVNTIFHGYTYSAHPVPVAAALAALDVFDEEDVPAQVRAREKLFEDALHSLKGEPNVIDVRNIGLAGAVEFTPIDGRPTLRGYQITERLLDRGFYTRWTGDIASISPPFFSTESELTQMIETMREVIRENATQAQSS